MLGILLIGGVAMAGDKKKKQVKPDSFDDDDDEVEDEISVTTPDESAEIVIEDDDTSDDTGDGPPLDEVMPDILEEVENKSPTKADENLEEVVKNEGVREEEAVSEVVEEITDGEGAPPIAAEETTPEMDPHGTVSLARIMLAREELPDWKSDLQTEVEEWQSSVELNPDGKFGIKSAVRMAAEVGILPLVRYFPKDTYTKKQAKQRYDAAISDVIKDLNSDLPDSQAQIDAITLSMAREKAQAWGNKPGPQNTREFIQDVNDSIAELAETEAERELDNA